MARNLIEAARGFSEISDSEAPSLDLVTNENLAAEPGNSIGNLIGELVCVTDLKIGRAHV